MSLVDDLAAQSAAARDERERQERATHHAKERREQQRNLAALKRFLGPALVTELQPHTHMGGPYDSCVVFGGHHIKIHGPCYVGLRYLHGPVSWCISNTTIGRVGDVRCETRAELCEGVKERALWLDENPHQCIDDKFAAMEAAEENQ